jgi:hypothetical protein
MKQRMGYLLGAWLLPLLIFMWGYTGMGADEFRAEQGPTPTPSPAPVFSATMSIISSQNKVAVGDTLVVTVTINVSEGCVYPIYEMSLPQVSDDGGEFVYLSPPTHTVGPPVTNPFSYTLTAVHTGTVSFSGETYGERYCGDYWNWQYVNGSSDLMQIVAAEPLPQQNQIYLPWVR